MYTLLFLITVFLLGAYFLRNQVPIKFLQQHEKQVAGVTAGVTFLSGILLTAEAGGFEPKLGIFLSMLGLLTLIAKQHPDTVLRALEGLGSYWNPFTHRFFSPILGWPLFLMGLVIATPPALWIDLIGVAIIYGIAVVYAQQKKSKIEP
ncbi:hypothetical protein [Nitrosococcus wardiae]|uniref:Uncharacterized protein n=1 Tax=Nitrosococcus wardiae TaxID=1814290 RepID=A0A4P7BVN1_9GAMM|nr:hypothetical protein [Nitrosococcus wardiae]QBQ54083.1 hypothetical protein E3U44_05865 [Nitrosococcus wardiae]